MKTIKKKLLQIIINLLCKYFDVLITTYFKLFEIHEFTVLCIANPALIEDPTILSIHLSVRL